MKTNTCDKRWFRLIAVFIAVSLVIGMSYTPLWGKAYTSSLCVHHPYHTEGCGWSGGVEGVECNHVHTDECYEDVVEVTDDLPMVGPEGAIGEEDLTQEPVTEVETTEVFEDLEPDSSEESASEEDVVKPEPSEDVEEAPSDVEEESPDITPSEEPALPVERVLICNHADGCPAVVNDECSFVPAVSESPCTFNCIVCNWEHEDEDFQCEFSEDVELHESGAINLMSLLTVTYRGNDLPDDLSLELYSVVNSNEDKQATILRDCWVSEATEGDYLVVYCIVDSYEETVLFLEHEWHFGDVQTDMGLLMQMFLVEDEETIPSDSVAVSPALLKFYALVDAMMETEDEEELIHIINEALDLYDTMFPEEQAEVAEEAEYLRNYLDDPSWDIEPMYFSCYGTVPFYDVATGEPAVFNATKTRYASFIQTNPQMYLGGFNGGSSVDSLKFVQLYNDLSLRSDYADFSDHHPNDKVSLRNNCNDVTFAGIQGHNLREALPAVWGVLLNDQRVFESNGVSSADELERLLYQYISDSSGRGLSFYKIDVDSLRWSEYKLVNPNETYYAVSWIGRINGHTGTVNLFDPWWPWVEEKPDYMENSGNDSIEVNSIHISFYDSNLNRVEKIDVYKPDRFVVVGSKDVVQDNSAKEGLVPVTFHLIGGKGFDPAVLDPAGTTVKLNIIVDGKISDMIATVPGAPVYLEPGTKFQAFAQGYSASSINFGTAGFKESESGRFDCFEVLPWSEITGAGAEMYLTYRGDDISYDVFNDIEEVDGEFTFELTLTNTQYYPYWYQIGEKFWEPQLNVVGGKVVSVENLTLESKDELKLDWSNPYDSSTNDPALMTGFKYKITFTMNAGGHWAISLPINTRYDITEVLPSSGAWAKPRVTQSVLQNNGKFWSAGIPSEFNGGCHGQYLCSVDDAMGVRSFHHIRFTNKPSEAKHTVIKDWDDGNSESRPSSVEMELYADEKPTGDKVTLSADNAWTYTWLGLKGGVKYSAVEVDTPDNYLATYNTEGDVTTVTNTFVPPQKGMSSIGGGKVISEGGNGTLQITKIVIDQKSPNYDGTNDGGYQIKIRLSDRYTELNSFPDYWKGEGIKDIHLDLKDGSNVVTFEDGGYIVIDYAGLREAGLTYITEIEVKEAWDIYDPEEFRVVPYYSGDGVKSSDGWIKVDVTDGDTKYVTVFNMIPEGMEHPDPSGGEEEPDPTPENPDPVDPTPVDPVDPPNPGGEVTIIPDPVEPDVPMSLRPLSNEVFTFNITLKDTDGSPLLGTYAVVTELGEPIGSVKNGSGSFTLGRNEGFFIHDLPAGVQYSISEEAVVGWNQVYTEDTSGVTVDGKVSYVTFINQNRGESLPFVGGDMSRFMTIPVTLLLGGATLALSMIVHNHRRKEEA